MPYMPRMYRQSHPVCNRAAFHHTAGIDKYQSKIVTVRWPGASNFGMIDISIFSFVDPSFPPSTQQSVVASWNMVSPKHGLNDIKLKFCTDWAYSWGSSHWAQNHHSVPSVGRRYPQINRACITRIPPDISRGETWIIRMPCQAPIYWIPRYGRSTYCCAV